MVQKIDGRAIAERIKGKIAGEIFKFKKLRPNLAIILVGERADSKLYVSLKEREGKKVGIDTHLYQLTSDVSEKELLAVINFLNHDQTIDGILVQLPLPKKFNTNQIIHQLNPQKDVDGFHPDHPDYLLSPVLASINASLERIKFISQGKKACLLYNSDIFGLSVKKLLEQKNMEVFLQHNSQNSDLLITSQGKPQIIKKEMIKEQAVIIDIGITSVGKKVLGDVDYESIKDKASFITPVPGGIGPLTIAFLFKNTLEIFKRRSSLNPERD